LGSANKLGNAASQRGLCFRFGSYNSICWAEHTRLHPQELPGEFLVPPVLPTGWLVSYSPVPEARSQLEQIGGMRLRTGQGGHSHLPEEGMVLHAASPQVFAGRFARRLESVGAQLVLETESGIQSQRCDKHKSRVTMRTQDWELRTGNWKLHWDMPTKEAE